MNEVNLLSKLQNKKQLKKAINIADWFLLLTLVLILPLNLFFKVNETNSFVNGLQIDYLINKIYLIEILAGLSLFFLPKYNSQNNKIIYIFISFCFLGIRQFFTPYPSAAFSFFLSLLLLIMWAIWLISQPKKIRSKNLHMALLASFCVQFSLGLFQFFAQEPLLPYKFLAEPRFQPYFKMSRFIFWGQEKILAYGSTAHPNNLATVISCFSLLLILHNYSSNEKRNKKILFCSIVSIMSLVMIYLTQAKMALLSLLIGNLIIWQKKLGLNLTNKLKAASLASLLIGMPIFFFIIEKSWPIASILRRNFLNQAAVKMITQKPILGQGLNQFAAKLELYSNNREVVRFIQPAHHFFLLLMAEIGLLGLAILSLVTWQIPNKAKKKIIEPLLILSPLLATDHFFYSQAPGRFLFVFFIASWIFIRDKRFKWTLE